MKKKVEAIVLAGGKGTRLAPLTEDTPKPLLKVMGKPVIESVFDRIADAGIERAVVTTMYLPWQIESLGNEHNGMKINYVREKEPLGTAGAAAGAYDGNADTLIILSGDGLFDFDLKKILDFHFEKNADVTIVTYKTENPLDFGVVLYNDDGKITRFEEKPPWAKVISGKINTGIYVINSDIIDKIPNNTQYDFAKQLFPLLLAQQKQLFAYETEGIWHDIGNLDGYFEANKTALDGKISKYPNKGFSAKELKERGIEAEEPFYVSRNAIVGSNVKIGSYTVIGDEAVISDNCDISSSIIGDGVSLGIGCGIYGSIIGRNTRLGENCITSEGCVIGANASSDDSIILPKYSFIHSGERISSGEYRERPCGKREKNIFTENGICCNFPEKSPEYILRLGFSAANTAKERKPEESVRIGIMTDNNSISVRTGRLILEGARSAGIRTVDFGCGYAAMARFAATEFITDNIIYVSRNKEGHIYAKIFGSAGIPVSDSFEQELTSFFFSHTEYTAPERFYETDTISDISMLYYSTLIKKAKKLLPNGKMKDFICSFGNIGNIRAGTPSYTAICAITELGGTITKNTEETDICFELDECGDKSSCISRTVAFDSYHMNAAILSDMKSEYEDEALYFSCSMPDVYRQICEKNGFHIIDYAGCSDSDINSISCESVNKLYFLEDAVFRTILFAIFLYKSKVSLSSISDSLPAFGVFIGNYKYVADRAGIMQRLAKLTESSENPPKEGIRIRLSNGTVTVVPNKLSGFRIISEAASIEAAKELCDKAEEYLK